MNSMINKIVNGRYDQYGDAFLNETPQDGVVASFTISQNSITQGDTIAFENTSTGFITNYEWYLNDVLVSNEKNPSIRFVESAQNTVGLYVSGGGYHDEYEVSYNVLNGYVIDFTADNTVGEVGLVADFESFVEGGQAPYTYEWSKRLGNDSYSVFSTLENPTETFNTLGCWDIKLVVTDDLGIPMELVKSCYISIFELNADFMGSPLTGEIPLDVTFTNTSTGDVETYLWEISGDGVYWVAVGTNENLNYTFQFPVDYSVRLTITAGTATSTITKNNYIQLADGGSGLFETYTFGSTNQLPDYSVTILHNMGTSDVDYIVYDGDDSHEVVDSFTIVDDGRVDIGFSKPIVGTYKILLMGYVS